MFAFADLHAKPAHPSKPQCHARTSHGYSPPAQPIPLLCPRRGLLSTLRLRHAYINCNETSRVRPLLCSVLHQLKGGKRQRDDGYECGVKCDSIADFRTQLPGACGAGRPAGAGMHAGRIARASLGSQGRGVSSIALPAG